MREIRTSGLMSGEGKRSGAAWPKPPRPSSTLLRRQKNDAADAAGICEAVTRPSMRFVGVRTLENQAALMHHKAREMLVAQRTQLINALRGHLAEIGVIAAQGPKNAYRGRVRNRDSSFHPRFFEARANETVLLRRKSNAGGGRGGQSQYGHW